MDLGNLKDRTVACFSISAKSQNRLDVALKWLSDLQPKKWYIPPHAPFIVDSHKKSIISYLDMNSTNSH